jgi:hypothetical protein
VVVVVVVVLVVVEVVILVVVLVVVVVVVMVAAVVVAAAVVVVLILRIRWSFAGLSSRRPASVHVEFLLDKVALGQAFLRVHRFPCQYHSTMDLYTHIGYHLGDEKWAGWRPQFRDIISLHRHEQYYYYCYYYYCCCTTTNIIFSDSVIYCFAVTSTAEGVYS